MGAGVDYHLLAGIAAVAETACRLDPNVAALGKMDTYSTGAVWRLCPDNSIVVCVFL